MRGQKAKMLRDKAQDFAKRQGIKYSHRIYPELKKLFLETPKIMRKKMFN